MGAQKMSDIGPHNLLIGEHRNYSADSQTFKSANTIFSETFSEGFAFEVMEVYSGPPSVSFKWRHFGTFSGSFKDRGGIIVQGGGQMVSFYGMCLATVSKDMVIE